MSSTGNAFSASIGKKMIMGLTGLFLILFLMVHCFINSLIFFNDGGLTFNIGADFMAHNWLIRAGEIFLFIGLLLHIFQAVRLTMENRKARPIQYAAYNGNANSKWYSRSMGLLGTLLLIFLVVHLGNFWVKSRFTGLPGLDGNGNENLYAVMQETFSNVWFVALYVFSMFSLAFHLMHGFWSAFQTMGWDHKKYTPFIKRLGFWFSIIIAIIFAAMPIAMYLQLVQ